MHYKKEIMFDGTYVLIVKYTENGPLLLHLLNKHSSFVHSFQFRDAARLGWALLDGATATAQPKPVKAGE